MPREKNLSMHAFAWATILLWSLAYVLTRIAVVHFTPEALGFLRYAAAGLTLLIYAVVKKMRLPKLSDVPLFLFGGAVGFAGYVYVFNMGSKTLSASVVSFIISASPVITALLARFFLRERIGLWGWASVLCAFAGVGVITVYHGGLSFSSGILWECAAALMISVYNVFQRQLLKRYKPLEITAYCIISGAVMLCVFAPRAFAELPGTPAPVLLAVVILGVFCAGAAYVCWANALSKARTTNQVANYMFLTPIITTFLGFVMIDEAPRASAYVGGGLVLASLLLLGKR